MIARTLAFTTPGKLSARDEQLVWDGENDVHATAPIEDLGFVIVENERMSQLQNLSRYTAAW